MLVVFPPRFVVDIKIIYGYNFVAPLKTMQNNSQSKILNDY